ncbi:MAG: hypothetical protein GXY01_09050 [Clostridiales bacterium]|nr:hypothetical protein [Clostridiales bacterium]
MQLLQITTTPMKYELEIEPARLEYKQDFIPSSDMQNKPAKLNIDKIKNTEVKIDTYEARKSLGIKNVADLIKQNAEKSKEHIRKQMREYVEIGQEMSNIQDSVSIADIFRSKILEQPQLYTAYLPNVGADLSWSPAQLDLSYEAGNLDYNWQISGNELTYIPGSVRVKISELASIDIEYLGGPLYFPPSAAPDYEEPEA